MSTTYNSNDKDTANIKHTPEPYTGTTGSAGTSMGEKLSGMGNVVHGAGDVIRGYAIDMAECGHGSGKVIAGEGKAEVERGFSKIHGTPIPGSAADPTRGTDGLSARTGTKSGTDHNVSRAAALAPGTGLAGNTGVDPASQKTTAGTGTERFAAPGTAGGAAPGAGASQAVHAHGKQPAPPLPPRDYPSTKDAPATGDNMEPMLAGQQPPGTYPLWHDGGQDAPTDASGVASAAAGQPATTATGMGTEPHHDRHTPLGGQQDFQQKVQPAAHDAQPGPSRSAAVVPPLQRTDSQECRLQEQ
ncbi:hypothetical protein BC834DRAFT_971888 [Gloeopeniophorella convolvens]|nr:hypothetical protein BC834DRAFT_971888 [Gloeopeniophorella convolvens]